MSLITGWAVSNVAFDQPILKDLKIGYCDIFPLCHNPASVFMSSVYTESVCACHAPLQEVGSLRAFVLCNRCDHWSGPVCFHHCSISALSGTSCVYCSEKEGGNSVNVSVNGLVAHVCSLISLPAVVQQSTTQPP